MLLQCIQPFLAHGGVPNHGEFINIKPVHIVNCFFLFYAFSEIGTTQQISCADPERTGPPLKITNL